MRLLRVPLPGSLPAHRAAALVRDDAHPFALVGAWAGGGAIAGSEPVRVAREDEDPFALLAEMPCGPTATDTGDARGRAASHGAGAARGRPLSPAAGGDAASVVGGGWVGFLGYALGGRLERLDPAPPVAPLLPPFALAFYDHVIRMDGGGRWWFEALVTAEREAAILARRDVLAARLTAPPAPQPFSTVPWVAQPSPRGHAAVVSTARTRIHAGDLFQANLSLVLRSRLRGDAGDLFGAGVRALAPDRGAFVAGPWGAVASLSPELFLARHGREVRSEPIKGTRPRPADPAAADRERRALLGSDKDRAENVMIVDLVRNDLGRVCEPGSVRVTSLARAEAHAGVWHLVSTVEGLLGENVDDAALVGAAFPPGSVTGAPKVAAMDVIAELESSARGAYTGAIGFASPLAGLELSVAIRTFEARGRDITLAVGGGVVADSDPEVEAAEAMGKAAPLLRAIGGAVGEGRVDSGGASPPLRLRPRPVPRPDPARGVFETMRVQDGEVVAAALHLRRLAASVRVLYRAALPPDLAEKLAAAASRHEGAARLRLDARPHTGALETTLAVTELPPLRAAGRLLSVTVPGGIGRHKWADRELLEALERRVGDAQPLLLDADGNVLEASRWSLVAVLDGVLVAPPADGRILPSVGRRRALDAAGRLGLPVAERLLHRRELEAASELVLVNALRGARPAISLDASALWRPGPVAAALDAALAPALRAAPTRR